VVELVYTYALEAYAFGIEGSTPSERTMECEHTIECWEKQAIRGCTCGHVDDCFKCKIKTVGALTVPGGYKDSTRMK
jgi:hypothetical protein